MADENQENEDAGRIIQFPGRFASEKMAKAKAKLSRLEEIIEQNPKDTKAYYQAAKILNSQKDFEASVDFLWRAYNNIKDDKILLDIGNHYDSIGDFTQARNIYDGLSKKESDITAEAKAKLEKYHEDTVNLNNPFLWIKLPDAVKLKAFEKAITKDPTYLLTYFQLSHLLNLEGQQKNEYISGLFKNGIFSKDSAKQLAQEFGHVFFHEIFSKAESMGAFGLRKYRSCEKDIKKYSLDLLKSILEIYPESTNLKCALLDCYSSNDDHEDVVKLAEQLDDAVLIGACNKGPALHLMKHYHWANALNSLKKNKEALSHYKIVIQEIEKLRKNKSEISYAQIFRESCRGIAHCSACLEDWTGAAKYQKYALSAWEPDVIVFDEKSASISLNVSNIDSAYNLIELNSHLNDHAEFLENKKLLLDLIEHTPKKYLNKTALFSKYCDLELIDLVLAMDEAHILSRTGKPITAEIKQAVRKHRDESYLKEFMKIWATNYFGGKVFIGASSDLELIKNFINHSLGEPFLERVVDKSKGYELMFADGDKLNYDKLFASKSAHSVKKYQSDKFDYTSERVAKLLASLGKTNDVRYNLRKGTAQYMSKVYFSQEKSPDMLAFLERDWLCRTKSAGTVKTPTFIKSYSFENAHINHMEDLRGYTLEKMLSVINACLSQPVSNKSKKFLQDLRDGLIFKHIDDTVYIKTNPSELQESMALQVSFESILMDRFNIFGEPITSKAKENLSAIGKFLEKYSNSYYRDSAVWNAKLSFFDILLDAGATVDSVKAYADNQITEKEIMDEVLSMVEYGELNLSDELIRPFTNNLYQIDFEKLYRKTFPADDMLFITEHPAVKASGKVKEYEDYYKQKMKEAGANSEEIDKTQYYGSFVRHIGFYYYIAVKKSMDPTNGTPEEHMGQAYSSLHMAVYNKEPDKENAGLKDIIELLEKADLSNL